MSERIAQTALREVARAEPLPAQEPAVAPAPDVPPEPQDAQPPPATTTGPSSAGTTAYRRRVLLVLSSIALALALYWASGYFLAYTDDAYVTSDLVSVAPYVSGRIVGVIENIRADGAIGLRLGNAGPPAEFAVQGPRVVEHQAPVHRETAGVRGEEKSQ